MQSGLVFNIQHYSLHDGPGIRTTVFLKGCPMDCWWCHNPESQSAGAELLVTESRCIRCGECFRVCPEQSNPPSEGGGRSAGVRRADGGPRCRLCGACVTACPTGAREIVGRRMSTDEVLAEVLKDRIFYDESGGGATFSGGEPLIQEEFLVEVLSACRAHGIHSAVDTCGFAPRETLLRIAALTDLVLYDLKLADPVRHIQFTGVANSPIIENLKALGQAHPRIWLRIPLVEGVNTDAGELAALAALAQEAATVSGVQQVNLLPYHETGARKFQQLGRPYRLPDRPRPSADALAQAAEIFRARGLPTKIGG